MFSSSPLGVDLTRAVESMEFDRPGVFGSGGAYAQVFALFTSASAGGVLVGPAWTSFAYGEVSWTFLVVSLGLLNISVAIPVVCSLKARSSIMTLDLTIVGAPAPVYRLENATSSSATVTSARTLASVIATGRLRTSEPILQIFPDHSIFL